jgi:hypothetical protein
MAISRFRVTRFKISGYKYAMMHSAMHVVLAALLYFAVQPDLEVNMTKVLPILMGMVIVDFDHIPIWRERGIRGYLKLRSMEEFGKPRRYAMHNFFFLIGSLGGSLLLMLSDFFPIGLFSASLAVHLLWDFLEDMLIFDMGYGHWI